MINGIGTRLSGKRIIDRDELMYSYLCNELNLDINSGLPDFFIATKSFVLFYIPVIPLETIIYYDIETEWYQDNQYVECCYPAGKNKVLWSHVKSSYSFYLFITIMFIYCVWLFI